MKDSKGKKRAKMEEDDGMMEDENSFDSNQDMMGGHDHMEKDSEEDHTKIVRESERRHANNARERYVVPALSSGLPQ